MPCALQRRLTTDKIENRLVAEVRRTFSISDPFDPKGQGVSRNLTKHDSGFVKNPKKIWVSLGFCRHLATSICLVLVMEKVYRHSPEALRLALEVHDFQVRSSLDALSFHLLHRIIDAAGGFPPYYGLVPLACQSAENLRALCKFSDNKKIHLFYDKVDLLASRLMSCKLSAHFFARPDPRTLPLPWRMLAENAGGFSRSVEEKILAVKGLALANAVSQKLRISESLASHVLTLGRSAGKAGKRAEAWLQLAENLSFDEEALKHFLTSTTSQPVQEFVVELLALLDGRIPDLDIVNEVEQKQPSNHLSDGFRQCEKGNEALQPDSGSDDVPDSDEEAPDADGFEGSFIRWQWVRATRASRLDSCGFAQGWRHLHPAELQAVTRKLADLLRDENPNNRKLACLALLSLAVGLPAKMALEVSLMRNDDLWIDLGAGLVCWNLAQIVAREHADEELLRSGFFPAEIVRLPLPQALFEALGTFGRSEATTLKNLLFPENEDIQGILSDYEEFLKLGDPTSHPPRPSRFAYSLGRCILHCTGQDVVAAMSSLDFVLAAEGQLNYFCIEESEFCAALATTYEFLGLGKLVPIQNPGWVGSPLRPRIEVVKAGFDRIGKRIDSLLERMAPNVSVLTAIEIFNELSLHLLVAVVFLTGHRGSRLRQLTFAMLFASQEFVAIRDKESTEYSAIRILPRYPLLAACLELCLKCLKSIAVRLERHDRKIARRLNGIASGKRLKCPVFVQIVSAENEFSLRALGSSDLSKWVWKEFGEPKNFGRHHWLSLLVEKKTPRMLIRFFLGHVRKGMEPNGSSMVVTVRAAAMALGEVLQQLAFDCGFGQWPLDLSSSAQSRGCLKLVPCLTRGDQEHFNRKMQAFRKVITGEAKLLVEPCPFTPWTVAGHALLQRFQKNFPREAAILSPWARVLVALIVYEGRTDLAGMRQSWPVIVQETWRLENIPVITWKDANQGRVPLMLQPQTSLFLNAAVLEVQPDFENSAAEVSRWLEGKFGGKYWAKSEQTALDWLAAMAQCWLSIEVPPWLQICLLEKFAAASISFESLARLIYRRPALVSDDESDQKLINQVTSPASAAERQLEYLAGRLAYVSDRERKLGENTARRSLLVEEIDKLLAAQHGGWPLVADIAKWLRHEASTESRILDVGSLNTYLSKLKTALKELDPGLVFEDFDREDWLRFASQVEADHDGEALRQQRSIFRRFALYFRGLGCNVPFSLLAGSDDPPASCPVQHASMIFVTNVNAEEILRQLEIRLGSNPLLSEMAACKFGLCFSGSFRTSEINCLRIVDVGLHLPCVYVTSSGFSHLKNQEKSRGMVLIDPAWHRRLLALCERIRDSPQHASGWIFLTDDTEASHEVIHRIDREIGRALRIVTGESHARIHSLRGSSASRSILPDVEKKLADLVHGICMYPILNSDVIGWLSLNCAAVQARHRQAMTTMSSYISIWPVALHFALHNALQYVVVEDVVADFVVGWSRVAARQALSRYRRLNDEMREGGWQIVQKKLKNIGDLPNLELLLTEGKFNAEARAVNAIGIIDALAELTFLSLRLSGIGVLEAMDDSGLGLKSVPALEKSLKTYREIFNMQEMPVSTRQARLIRKHYAEMDSCELLSNLVKVNDARKIMGLQSLIGDREPKIDDETCLFELLRVLRFLLPGAWTFTILPSRMNASPTLALKVRTIDPFAQAKPVSQRLSTGFKIVLTSKHMTAQGPRPDGMKTAMFGFACHAFLVLFNHC